MVSIDEMLRNKAFDRCEKILNTIDRQVLRAWLDGYKAALEDRGLVTTAGDSKEDHRRSSDETSVVPSPQPAGIYEIPTEALPSGWRKVYHLRGDHPCGKPALLITRPVYADEKADLSLLRFINGTAISPDDQSVCGSCRHPIHVYSNADLDWMPHRLPARRTYTYSFAESLSQSEPGPDDTLTSMDPAPTRHPASVLADMRTEIFQPYSAQDEESVPPEPLATHDELEELKSIAHDLGLPDIPEGLDPDNPDYEG